MGRKPLWLRRSSFHAIGFTSLHQQTRAKQRYRRGVARGAPERLLLAGIGRIKPYGTFRHKRLWNVIRKDSFKCGGLFHPHHQCPNKALRVMVVEEESDEENDVRVMNDEDVEHNAEELPLNVLTFENVLTFDRTTKHYEDRLNSIKLQGTVGTMPVLMLVESGANQNFMSRRLAVALSLNIIQTLARPIKLGDGFTPGLVLCAIIYRSNSWRMSWCQYLCSRYPMANKCCSLCFGGF